jgi:2-oxoglutarate dehydrogenase E2 component (dihydrolipoamide succinyltransferase)
LDGGYFNVGVAIASERGLVVPVLRSAERMSFAEIEKAIGDFAKRAQNGKLKPDELEDGTFTITNGGVFGSLLSTPIINPPQTGILGMHATQEPTDCAGRTSCHPPDDVSRPDL